MTIEYVRLTNDTNLVAEVEPVEGGLRLNRPVFISFVWSEKSQAHQLVLDPWLPVMTCDVKEVVIAAHQILFHLPLLEDVRDAVVKQQSYLYDELKREVVDRRESRKGNAAPGTAVSANINTDDPFVALSALYGDHPNKDKLS